MKEVNQSTSHTPNESTSPDKHEHHHQELPMMRYEEFLALPDNRIKAFVRQHGVKTVYLPVDGTRRTFLWHVSKNNDFSVDSLKDEKTFLELYSEFLIPTMINFLSKFYDLGIRTIIFLLMDKTAFSRGKTYLEKSAQLGIRPLGSDARYLEFFKKHEVRVVFGGFNHLYEQYGLGDLLKMFEDVEDLTQNHDKHDLVFYTGSSPEEDYLLVSKVIAEMNSNNENLTRNSLIRRIYKINLDPIDFGLFYGFPRDKILPPLIWGNSVRFYSKNPSLTLTRNQIKTAIYYTALSRFLIRDDYRHYPSSGSSLADKNSKLGIFSSQASKQLLLGPELYDFPTMNDK